MKRGVREAEPYFQSRTLGVNTFTSKIKGSQVNALILRVADPEALIDNIINHDTGSKLNAEVAKFYAPFLKKRRRCRRRRLMERLARMSVKPSDSS